VDKPVTVGCVVTGGVFGNVKRPAFSTFVKRSLISVNMSARFGGRFA
jgi:hypothetical protein